MNANDPIKPEVTGERAVATDSEVPETDLCISKMVNHNNTRKK